MIIDYSVMRPTMQELKQADVTAVGRYLGWDSVPGFPSIGKNISAVERKELLRAGMAVFLAFEYGADAALNGAPQGEKDGKLAASQLHEYGFPANMGVYFALDFDLQDYAPALPNTPGNARAKLGPVAAYFDAIHAQKPAYQVGGYGGYWAIKRLFDAGLITLGWQTIAWSGGQWDNRAQLRQLASQVLGAADVNLHLAGDPDFGQDPAPAVTHTPVMVVSDGTKNLHEIADELKSAASSIIRQTAHSSPHGRFERDTAKWLNDIFAGHRTAVAPVPAKIRLWVPR